MAAVDARTCPICGATVPASMWHNCNDHMTPPAAPENRRWAAFTDDELEGMSDALAVLAGWCEQNDEGNYVNGNGYALTDEIKAELKRRRT